MRACFHTDAGILIEGEVIEHHLTEEGRVSATILTAAGQTRVTFRNEAAYRNALGQRQLFRIRPEFASA